GTAREPEHAGRQVIHAGRSAIAGSQEQGLGPDQAGGSDLLRPHRRYYGERGGGAENANGRSERQCRHTDSNLHGKTWRLSFKDQPRVLWGREQVPEDL